LRPVDHLDLVVNDLERSLEFYNPEGIKLEIVHRPTD
jgi:hypothetical protein